MNIATLAVSNYNAHIPAIPMMLGDEVFITGAFWNRLGEKRNIPIVRTGNIAALHEEPVERFSPRQAAYLVETRSLGGISGSPVFFDPHTRYGRWRSATGQIIDTNPRIMESSEPTVIVPYRFVGMVLGTWSSNVSMDFLPDDDSEKNRDSDWNTGISVIIPDFRIMEFLMSPALKQQRLQSVEEREKRSGARFTSARRHEEKIQADADEAENPNHLEDFSRLVDVAARKRKQDDQS